MAIKTIELLKGSASQEELMEVITAVASDLGDVIDDVNTLQVIPLKGAMTNEVFQINWPTKNDGDLRKVLVRLYGEGVEIFFNRDEEIRTFECISKHGQGPRLLARFTTGRVEEFIHARVCDSLILFFLYLYYILVLLLFIYVFEVYHVLWSLYKLQKYIFKTEHILDHFNKKIQYDRYFCSKSFLLSR